MYASIAPSFASTRECLISNGSSYSDEEIRWAADLINQQRNADGKGKKTKYSGQFAPKEAYQILANITAGSIPQPTTGLVNALLIHYKAHEYIRQLRNTNVFKKVMRVSTPGVLTTELVQATQNCSPDIVRILLLHADDIAKSQALHIAVQQNDVLKLQYILESGADTSILCNDIQALVQNTTEDIFDILIHSLKTKWPTQEDPSSALIIATSLGSLRKCQALLANGASATYQNGEALFSAIKTMREDIVIAITGCTTKVSVGILDTAVRHSYDQIKQNAPVEICYNMMRHCLEAGARGDATYGLLVEAVKTRQMDLVSMLVQHGALADENSRDVLV